MIGRINGEPVELVMDFGALRVGDVVYYMRPPCETHPHHRLFLVSYAPHWHGRHPLDCENSEAWTTLPRPPCAPSFALGLVVTPKNIERRRIYRVVNPPLASDDAEENRGLDRQRVRKALAR